MSEIDYITISLGQLFNSESSSRYCSVRINMNLTSTQMIDVLPVPTEDLPFPSPEFDKIFPLSNWISPHDIVLVTSARRS